MSPAGGGAGRQGHAADPLGKRALFGPPPEAPGGAEPAWEPGAMIDPFAPSAGGRRALFSEASVAEGPGSGPAAPAGRVRLPAVATVTCGSCGARTPLDPVGVTTRLMTSVWIPGRRWSRYLRCPACRRRAWCRIALGGS